MAREAKKYKCTVITGYKKPDGKFFKVTKSQPFTVIATSPDEARMIMNRDRVADYLSGLRPKRAREDPGGDLYPLEVKQVTATALKEDRAMELMGNKSLFDLSKFDPD